MKQRIPDFEHFSINEDPDNVRSKNFKGHHLWRDSDARPVGYLNGKMLIGDEKSRHKEQHPPKTRKDFKSPGRIWEKSKIISFWRIDSPLKTIIKDINTELLNIDAGFQIDSTWEIEVAKNEFSGDDMDNIKVLTNLFDFMKKERNGKTNKYDCEWENVTSTWVDYKTSNHSSLDNMMDDTPFGW